jgi:hypothetical protein
MRLPLQLIALLMLAAAPAAAQGLDKISGKTIVYNFDEDFRWCFYIAASGSVYERWLGTGKADIGIEYKIGGTASYQRTSRPRIGDPLTCRGRTTAQWDGSVLTLGGHETCKFANPTPIKPPSGPIATRRLEVRDNGSCTAVVDGKQAANCKVVAGNQMVSLCK